MREIQRVQALLSLINAELKSDLDQVLMLQEAIKANARPATEALPSPDPESFEVANAAKRRAIQREAALTARLEAIMLRSAALDARKQVLMERFVEIGVMPTAPASPAAKSY